MKRKICFVTTVPMTMRAFVLDAASYLHEKGGYEVVLACSPDEDFAGTVPDGVRFFPVEMKRGADLLFLKRILMLRRFFRKEKFDMVQYSTPNASLYASIASWLAGVPVRLYCQWGILYTGYGGLKRTFFKVLEKTVCRLSTWIEPDSFGNLEFSRGEGLYGEANSSVIWNGSACGIDPVKFDIGQKPAWRKETRDRYGIAEGSYVIGFVGRVTRDKGINELLSAARVFFKRHDEAMLMIVGDQGGSATIDPPLLEWSLNEKRIIYTGRMPDVWKMLSAMDLFILPSYREGFGSVVIEAGAMGLPVIVTDIPGPTEAIIEGVTGLVVEKGSPDQLLKAIEKIYQDKGMAMEFSAAGSDFTLSNFRRGIFLEKLLIDRERLLGQAND
ncbi:MAG: glycosyltransferase family 4 protein [Clostridia bacterium]|nr:glycosyltransferase family 4 protein [Clostridia bacterium]